MLGDIAAIAGPDGAPLPQLGSVALQSGRWAAKNILADVAGKERKPFHYKDKGIMAMIGRNEAVAEVGKRRHEVHGTVAFVMWLGVHASLMTGMRTARRRLHRLGLGRVLAHPGRPGARPLRHPAHRLG